MLRKGGVRGGASAAPAAAGTGGDHGLAEPTGGHHAALGELVTAQVGPQQLFVGAHGADADLLVDHVDPAEAVEADLVQALLAGLVDGVEPGAGVLLLPAVQRSGLCGLSLGDSSHGRRWHNFLLGLLLGLEAKLLLGGAWGHIVVVVVILNFCLLVVLGVLHRFRVGNALKPAVLALDQESRQAQQDEAQRSHGDGR